MMLIHLVGDRAEQWNSKQWYEGAVCRVFRRLA